MNLQDNPIDQKVREAFNQHEVAPPEGGWAHLEQALLMNKRAKVILLRRWILGAAAVFLAFFAGYQVALQIQDSNTLMPDIYTAQKIKQSDNLQVPATEKMQEAVHSPNIPTQSSPYQRQERQLRNRPAAGFATSGKQTTPVIDLNTYLELKESAFAADLPVFIPDEMVIPTLSFIIRPKDPIIAMVQDPPPSKELKTRWQVSALAGRTYSNYYTAGEAAVQDVDYQHNLVSSTRNQMTSPLISYGMALQYGIAPRFSLCTGASLTQFSTTLIPTSGYAAVLSNFKPVSNAFGEVEYNEATRENLEKTAMLEVTQGEIMQQFSWVEIPLYGSYTMVDGRIGFSIRAGLGSNVLQKNKVYLKEEGSVSEIGQTDGLRKIYLSGLAGFDLQFKIASSWNFSFSPTYRHSLQTVSTGSEAQPFLMNLGLYSGIIYRF